MDEGNLIMYPQECYGVEYCVDSVNGNDSNSGFDWGHAKKLLSAAISASNTYIAIAANANKRNTIYVGGGTYAETLATLPNQCDIVGVGCRSGWGPLINGVTTITTAVVGCHIYNMHFFQATGVATVSIPAGSAGVWFMGCIFSFSGTATHGLTLTSTPTAKVMDCQFDGDNPFPIGIQLLGTSSNFTRIERNYINATTTGILTSSTMSYADWGVLIKDNVICRCDTSSDAQLATGIHIDSSRSGAMIVNNQISAVNAILCGAGTLDGNREQWMCIGNRVGENANSGWEDGSVA